MLRCAAWTRRQGVDPIGTAGRFDDVVLVEVPPPWPRDVSEIPALAAAAAGAGATRVLAVVPRGDADPGTTLVVHWRRDVDGRLTGRDHRCSPGAVAGLLAALLTDPDGAADAAVGPAPPDVVICTHGRRDTCCGGAGTRLHAEVDDRWDGVRTWRSSHVGAHRFAPTALTFPDGRAWGALDADLLDGIVRRTIAPDRLAGHDRGSTALDPWAQVVERELFARTGWAWADHDRVAGRTVVASDGRSAAVSLTWRDPAGRAGRAIGVVEVVREVPVLDCGRPPEDASKTSLERALRSLTTGPAPSSPERGSPVTRIND